MSTRIGDRTRSRAIGLAVAAVAAAALTVAGMVGLGVPDGWWPTAGQAFASSTPQASGNADDPCALIVGPARDYCTRGALQSAAPAPEFTAVDAWMLLPPAAGIAALSVYRIRTAPRRP
ncbi:hypothetical protein G6045_28265 [Streptomyces sp. YC504]|uniref:Uncharacterized protein n=1 Tax=Streptomyces mesophilus TaxID=1775132 RepID=A0A6G4XQ05_9ACTN|nr:hypothetical protein [Streptomyces mesophilus]NGO79518.1 hypothetical protein [Streptomyces mesophilus]